MSSEKDYAVSIRGAGNRRNSALLSAIQPPLAPDEIAGRSIVTLISAGDGIDRVLHRGG